MYHMVGTGHGNQHSQSARWCELDNCVRLSTYDQDGGCSEIRSGMTVNKQLGEQCDAEPGCEIPHQLQTLTADYSRTNHPNCRDSVCASSWYYKVASRVGVARRAYRQDADASFWRRGVHDA